MAKRILTLTTVAAFLALAPAAAEATPGQLDPTFGSGGRVTTTIGSDLSDASAVVVQRDGKIVVGGKADVANLALARFKPNGSLDNGFGNGGIVTTDFDRLDTHTRWSFSPMARSWWPAKRSGLEARRSRSRVTARTDRSIRPTVPAARSARPSG